MTVIDSGHHARSLGWLADADGGTAVLRSALVSLRPLLTASGFEVADLRWSEPSWRGRERPTWARSLYGQFRALQTQGMAEPSQREVRLASVPWLCDEEAERERPRRVHLPNGFDALYVAGRPLVALSQLRHRPGLHAWSGPSSERGAVLVPDLGRSVLLTLDAEQHLLARLGSREPGVLLGRDGPLALDGRAAIELDAILKERPGPRLWLGTLDTIDEVLQLSEPSGWSDRLTALAARLSDDGLRRAAATDIAASQVRCYGQLVLEALVAGFYAVAADPAVVSRVHAAASEGGADALEVGLAGVRTRTARALESLWIAGDDDELDPRDRYGGGSLLVADDQTSTLARVERRRTVTRLGPGGMNHLLGQRDVMRDTHDTYRRRLCPLQTPESQSIGLVRFLSIGATVPGAPVVAPGTAQHVIAESDDELSAAASLIPFVNHDDPARALIGAKNLKQAVPVLGAHPPLVRTGFEHAVAEHGVVRAPFAGTVDSTMPLTLRRTTTDELYQVPLNLDDGPPGPDQRWMLCAAEGDRVRRGAVLAHAPDVRLDENGAPVLSFGVDCLTAFTPMDGLNYEDAVVVSVSLAERLASIQVAEVREELIDGDIRRFHVLPGEDVRAGERLVTVFSAEGNARDILAPEAGRYLGMDADDRLLRLRLRVRRQLVAGDKLTNRHGAKGVVSRVLADADMPSLPDGTPVEMVCNPLGVLSRLNTGQLIEAAVGLAHHLSGEPPEPVGRRHPDLASLRSALDRLGAPDGCLEVRMPDGGRRKVAVGPIYVSKLDHLAANKLRVRAQGPTSPLTRQPARGTRWSGGVRIGGAQRLGEMELWALRAAGARALLDDALRVRSEPLARLGLNGSGTVRLPSVFHSVDQHLRAAGIGTGLLLVDEEPVDTATVEPGQELPGPLRGIVHWLTRGWEDGLDILGFDDLLPSWDREYTPDSGGFRASSVRCWCGSETEPGRTCVSCRGTARARWRSDSGAPQGCIVLPEPVPHPWFRTRLSELGVRRDRPELLDAMLQDGYQVLEQDDTLRREVEPLLLEALPVLGPGLLAGPSNEISDAYRHVAVAAREFALQQERGTLTESHRRFLWSSLSQLLGRLDAEDGGRSIAGRLNGKRGLLRRGLLGRQTDRTARGVIVPDPERDPEQVGLPGEVMDRLGLEDGSVVVLNRQPTLHPYNLVALKAARREGEAIGISTLLCAAIAGDFDGDEVTIHAPATLAAAEEAWDLLRPAHNQRSSSNGQPLSSFDHDVKLGLALRGRLFEPPRSQTRDELDLIWKAHREGLAAATGWSFSLLALSDAVWSPSSDRPHGADEDPDVGLRERLAETDPVGQAWDAGVAVDAGKLRQLLVERGPVDRFDPQLHSAESVPGCFVLGLDDEAYWQAAPGALRRLGDKKLLSPRAGGLTKRLAEIGYDLVISAEDCGTSARLPESDGVGGACRSPLLCDAAPGPCRSCYGPDPATGEAPPVGAAVGLLAAMLIGQRGTQLSMKTFQRFGAHAVELADDLGELRGLLGHGRFRLADETTRLDDQLGQITDDASRSECYVRLLTRFVELTGGALAPVHGAVLLRALIDADDEGRGSRAARAERTGVALLDAAARGTLTPLVASLAGPSGIAELNTSRARALTAVGSTLEPYR